MKTDLALFLFSNLFMVSITDLLFGTTQKVLNPVENLHLSLQNHIQYAYMNVCIYSYE